MTGNRSHAYGAKEAQAPPSKWIQFDDTTKLRNGNDDDNNNNNFPGNLFINNL